MKFLYTTWVEPNNLVLVAEDDDGRIFEFSNCVVTNITYGDDTTMKVEPVHTEYETIVVPAPESPNKNRDEFPPQKS